MIRRLTLQDFCARQERQGRSQRRFAELHPCEEVLSYCEIDSGLKVWSANAGRFAQFLRYVECLDRLDTLRADAGLEALNAYQDSLAIRDRLAKADPDNAGWQRDRSAV